jgi:hypothetical protein
MKSLPFAKTLGFAVSRPWVESIRGERRTGSERYLFELARRSFLTLWSFPNVYTDEGRRAGKGDGKELCDLLVMFGHHVVLFSDKDCEFKPNADPKTAWQRWYKRSIESSARQLAGAKSWVERFPHRLFLDRQCQHPLPLTLPTDGNLKIHLVAVVKGAAAPAVEHWKSVAKDLKHLEQLFKASSEPSSGSLMLSSRIQNSDHYDRPFQIGWPLGARQFIHVFDEESLDAVLGVLDTVPDFVRYLEQKEEFFSAPGREVVAPGEEDLLALYLESTRAGDRLPSFPEVGDDALVVLREGDWKRLMSSGSFRARERANRVSYRWDELIEFHTSHLVAGSSHTVHGVKGTGSTENLLRKMAEEPRLLRRTLGAAVHRARLVNVAGKRFSRTVMPMDGRGRVYIIMTLPKPKGMGYGEYVDHRRYELSLLCEGCAAALQHVDEVLGIAMEPYAAKTTSVDFALMILRDKQKWLAALPEAVKHAHAQGMWNSESKRGWHVREQEFPPEESNLRAVADAASALFRKVM